MPWGCFGVSGTGNLERIMKKGGYVERKTQVLARRPSNQEEFEGLEEWVGIAQKTCVRLSTADCYSAKKITICISGANNSDSGSFSATSKNS